MTAIIVWDGDPTDYADHGEPHSLRVACRRYSNAFKEAQRAIEGQAAGSSQSSKSPEGGQPKYLTTQKKQTDPGPASGQIIVISVVGIMLLN
ncbi:hypothetical protein BZG36_03405 [Bifiguratus adelaidae]|uniref:Uncharacterized protein n=1 Tax=Bifiguratus adelaidae TaxID=1938954 RepID=A0A261Y0F7_9FUNG|nr:hypothetical protein BZG36_03405 [Bifiguratus adelaidae]